MKILVIISTIVFNASLMTAQEEELWTSSLPNFIGLSASYSTSTNDISPNIIGGTIIISDSGAETKTTSYSFSASGGVFLNDCVAVGPIFSYDYIGFNSQSLGLSTTVGLPSSISMNERMDRNLSAGFFMRYIFNPKNRLQAYLQPSLSYVNGQSDVTNISSSLTQASEEKSNAVFANVSCGLTFNVTYNFRLITRLGGLTYENGSRDITSITSGVLITGGMPSTNMMSQVEETIDFSSFTTNFSIANIQFGAEYLF
jgi:hypothetical protein